MKHTEKPKTQKETRAEQELPGVAIDIADGDKTTPKEVDERTCTINNNPRNTDL